MPQLTFRWPSVASYSPEDFILSESNHAAAAFLNSWPDGRTHAALLIGPRASGKTHLLRRWATQHSTGVIDHAALGKASSETLYAGHSICILEDIDTVRDETALFHLLRHTEMHGLHLLVSSRVEATQLPFTLPDLRSRLLALPSVRILPPDETLLHGFLLKYFSDHQLRVSEDVIRYMAQRTERSFAGAQALAHKVERASSETRREITIPLVRSLLENM